MSDLNNLKKQFIEWVMTNPLIYLPDGPPKEWDRNKTMYLRHKDREGYHYEVQIDKIPLKFKPLVGR